MLSDQMVMPVTSMNNSDGFGNNSWWILLFFFAMFGFGGFGGYGGNDMMLPYMWNAQTQNDVNRGFDTIGIGTQLSGIQSSITNGFASTEVANCNRAMDSMQTAYNNQIASMNQRFADSTALTGQLNSLAMGLQQCLTRIKDKTKSLIPITKSFRIGTLAA